MFDCFQGNLNLHNLMELPNLNQMVLQEIEHQAHHTVHQVKVIYLFQKKSCICRKYLLLTLLMKYMTMLM